MGVALAALGGLDLRLQSMARHHKIGRSTSIPMHGRPRRTHAAKVVPEPMNGSRTTGAGLLHEALEQVYGLLRRVELLVEVDPVFLASAHATSPELAVMVRRHVQ